MSDVVIAYYLVVYILGDKRGFLTAFGNQFFADTQCGRKIIKAAMSVSVQLSVLSGRRIKIFILLENTNIKNSYPK